MSLLFFRRMLAKPLQVGYLVPSSPFLTRQTAQTLDARAARVVVELGPGEGCHTRQILRRLPHDARVILIEMDGEFVSHLREQFAGDPRVVVMQTDARHLRPALAEAGVERCDYIVSGLPFSLIGPAEKDALLDEIAAAMDADTRFVTYQVSLRQLETGVRRFELVSRSFCLWNVPPINVFEFRRA
jgi:phospholipid N-methyltransferase